MQAEEQLKNVYEGTPFTYDNSLYYPTLMAIMEDEDGEQNALLLGRINTEIENLSFQVFVSQLPPPIASPKFSTPSPPPIESDPLPGFVDPRDTTFDLSVMLPASNIYSPPSAFISSEDSFISGVPYPSFTPEKSKLTLKEYSARRRQERIHSNVPPPGPLPPSSADVPPPGPLPPSSATSPPRSPTPSAVSSIGRFYFDCF